MVSKWATIAIKIDNFPVDFLLSRNYIGHECHIGRRKAKVKSRPVHQSVNDKVKVRGGLTCKDECTICR